MEKNLRIYTLTFQFSNNYGAMLQAYALQTFLAKNGCNVQIVDYWPDYAKKHSHWYSVFINKPSPRNFLRMFSVIRTTKVFAKFKKNYLSLTQPCLSLKDIEALPPAEVAIAGSDQIWNPVLLGEYNDAYFLKFKTSAIKASYAASAGQDVFNDEELALFYENLRHLNYISVREKTFCETLKRGGISGVKAHLDPVFLLKSEDYRSISTCRRKGKYIVVYYNDKGGLTDEIALRLSKLKGDIPVYRIGKSKKEGIISLPFQTVNEFLGLIDHAEFIISSSFHATALSVIFQKQFYAVTAGDRSSRLTSMLMQFGLMDRYITCLEDFEKLGSSKINYKKQESEIERYSENAKEYLYHILSEARKCE